MKSQRKLTVNSKVMDALVKRFQLKKLTRRRGDDEAPTAIDGVAELSLSLSDGVARCSAARFTALTCCVGRR